MLSSIKTELTSLYHQYKIQKDNDSLYNTIYRHLIILSIITIAIFILGLNVIKFRKKKYNKEITQKSDYINTLQKKIEKTSSENKHIKLQMKNLEDEILDIKNRSRLDYVSFDQKIDSIKEHPIYKRLYNICIDSNIKTNTLYPDLQLNDFEQKETCHL